MNRFVFIIVMIWSAASYSATNQELFLRGNKAYQEQAYQDALHCYEEIADKGEAVWHHMGNCCYYLGKPIEARVYWQRAKRHAAYHDYVALETQLALLDAEEQDVTPSMFSSWISWMRAHTASWSLLLIQLLALIFWFALFISVRKDTHWSIMLTLALLSGFFIWLSLDLHDQRCRIYGVTIEEIPVYIGPHSSYHEQGVVQYARTVHITDEREGWYKIAYKGLAGWVQADKLVKV